MNLLVDEQIKLELVDIHHAEALFDLASENRTHIKQWMSWIDYMHSIDFMHNFVKNSKQRYADGHEYAYVIIFNDIVVGRIGVYKIDLQNKIGEIGYWISEEYQGYGITTKSCSTLIEYCFNDVLLNRIEIKCASENYKSQGIPERLNFTYEGTLREAELLNGKFVDLNLYSLLRNK